jgi:signal peptide peptidase SppA
MAKSSVLRPLLDPLRRLLPDAWRPGPVVPVVRLQGAIGIGGPFRPALTLAGVADVLERAFAVRDAVEVALIVNSPGGSAVQAHLIHRRIRALAEENGLGVTAFVEDAAASGGYMIACAADRIVVDPSSIVGSIGVISASFGFDRLIERIGVERRLHSAGERKSMLDPFLPERQDDVERLEALQREVHRGFIALVEERRGARLDRDDPALFTGEFWVGSRAVELGLADTLGDIRTTMHARYGDKVRLRLVGGRRPFLLRRLFGTTSGPALAGLGDEILTAVEERALWTRYGL